MDIIAHCEISCNFVSSKKKREALKRKLEDIRIYAGEEGVAELCKALNYVCEKPSIWSCLLRYDKNSGEYITNQCFPHVIVRQGEVSVSLLGLFQYWL